MGLKRLTAPAEEPVSLDEAKAHCRVVGSEDDALFTGVIIPAARELAEHRTGRALVQQQWELTLPAFPAAAIDMPKPPLFSVQSVKYVDAAGDIQTLAPAAYSVHTSALIGLISPTIGTSWPAAREQLDAVSIVFTAGYGAAADVPSGIKAWMLLAIGALYEHREAFITGTIVTELPTAFCDGLLNPYLVWRVV